MRRAWMGYVMWCGLIIRAVACTGEGKPSDGDPFPVAQGVFVLGRNNSAAPAWCLSKDFVDGASVRARWNFVEKERGRYDWSFLDNELAKVRRANKRAIIRITGGSHGCFPDYLKVEGAQMVPFKDMNPHHASYGEMLETVVPWDGVFLSAWCSFIRAFGSRYASEPAIGLIGMTGPGKTGGEMHLPQAEALSKPWSEYGYKKDKVVSAWKRVIDAYGEAFPRHYLGLGMAVPLDEPSILWEVTDYAKVRLGNRFVPMGHWLSGKWDWSKPTEQQKKVAFYRMIMLCRDWHGVGGKVGFQELCPYVGSGRFTAGGTRGGSAELGFRNAAWVGASFIEVYPPNLSSPEVVGYIKAWRREVGLRGEAPGKN